MLHFRPTNVGSRSREQKSSRGLRCGGVSALCSHPWGSGQQQSLLASLLAEPVRGAYESRLWHNEYLSQIKILTFHLKTKTSERLSSFACTSADMLMVAELHI